MNLKTKITSFLLNQANQVPDSVNHKEFYRLKTLLLEKYGRKVGEDFQLLEKECWACDGTGIYTGYNGWQDVCNRCFHGVYESFTVRLDLYEFGGYFFHIPRERISRWEGNVPTPTIKGYIRHYPKHRQFAKECAEWFFLLYDFKTFKYDSRPYIFESTLYPLSLYRKLKYKTKTLPKKVKKKWHEFCNKFNQWRSREQIISLNLRPDDEIPF